MDHAGEVHPESLADLAQHAALDAAEIVLVDRGAIRVAGTKSSSTDMVTETDRKVEEHLVATLTSTRPDDSVIGEEGGERSGDGPVSWIIDPIDGTTNFVYDLSGFNISVAAAIDGRVVAGIVVDPIRSEIFRATLGGGATCNGAKIRANRAVGLDQALVGTGFSYEAPRRREQGAVIAHIIDRVRDIRRQGAAALDLCNVASGRLDAFFESGLEPWDLAAGRLIAIEAGAQVGGLVDDEPDGRLTIAAAGELFEDLRQMLCEVRDAGLVVEGPSA